MSLSNATVETLHLSPLPCWRRLSSPACRERAVHLIREIEEKTAARTTRRQALGVAEGQSIRSDRPAPLFHAVSGRIRREFWKPTTGSSRPPEERRKAPSRRPGCRVPERELPSPLTFVEDAPLEVKSAPQKVRALPPGKSTKKSCMLNAKTRRTCLDHHPRSYSGTASLPIDCFLQKINKPILFLCSIYLLSCGQEASTSKRPSRIPLPVPSLPGEPAAAAPTSSPLKPKVSSKFLPDCTCESLGDGHGVEKCAFTLDGYSYRGPESYLHKDLPLFARAVAAQISTRLENRERQNSVYVVGKGFADGIPNPGTRRRDELTKECREKLKERPSMTINDIDLASTRECYVSRAIQDELGGAVHISWRTNPPHDEQDYGKEGPTERKVEIAVYATTEGGC